MDEPTRIESFSGAHRWLSNFWAARVVYEGRPYPTNEHAFQAAKTLAPASKIWIATAPTAGAAKSRGRAVLVRPDWDTVRLGVMETINRDKFTRHANLTEKLLATGTAELVEGNHWGDTFWGICKGIGENHLGKILMRIRSELAHG